MKIYNAIAAQHLYRIVQEAVANAARHSHGTRVVVILQEDRENFTLIIEDDGEGLPPKEMRKGMGMRTMAYRAELLGGILNVESERGKTRVICQIPDDVLLQTDKDFQEVIHV